VGDFFDKPIKECGIAVSRPFATAIIAGVMIVLILLILQRPGSHLGTKGFVA